MAALLYNPRSRGKDDSRGLATIEESQSHPFVQVWPDVKNPAS